MDMNHIRRGEGPPLLLIHGLGSTLRSWDLIIDELTAEREVVAIDLPGFGATPPLPGDVSIAALADALTAFMQEHDLAQADTVGSSMGARLSLELSRRGAGGATVALAPGGFWTDAQLRWFQVTAGASIRLVRALQPVAEPLAANPVTRTALLAQLSAAPWKLAPDLALRELRSLADSPSFDDVFRSLVRGPRQEGAPAGTTAGPIVIGWGRQDRLLMPSQAERATQLFPDARLHWFERCGHFPQLDQPRETARLVLASTG
ncbi:MAG: alpha/beta fold hydrolase [Solirubrobacterales bacterium]|nr:alpha/beta fold hydrolase [Solirubrobacterales bacterium]